MFYYPIWGTTIFMTYGRVPEMGNQLRSLRERAGFTHEEAGEAMGVSRSQFIKLERGERRLTSDYIGMAAKAFNVPEAEVIADRSGSVIKIVGLVAAGGSIETEWENSAEPLREIEIPFHLGADVIGFQIMGESMWPKYDPDDIIVVSRSGEAIETLLGLEAVVRCGDGNRYFKRIVRGSLPNAYALESYNAPTIRSREILWASGRIATVPAPRWRAMKRGLSPPRVRRKSPTYG